MSNAFSRNVRSNYSRVFDVRLACPYISSKAAKSTPANSLLVSQVATLVAAAASGKIFQTMIKMGATPTAAVPSGSVGVGKVQNGDSYSIPAAHGIILNTANGAVTLAGDHALQQHLDLLG